MDSSAVIAVEKAFILIIQKRSTLPPVCESLFSAAINESICDHTAILMRIIAAFTKQK